MFMYKMSLMTDIGVESIIFWVSNIIGNTPDVVEIQYQLNRLQEVWETRTVQNYRSWRRLPNLGHDDI